MSYPNSDIVRIRRLCLGKRTMARVRGIDTLFAFYVALEGGGLPAERNEQPKSIYNEKSAH